MIDSDDDYRVSYAITMVDVRSCARPPRLFCPKSSTYIGNVCIVTKIYLCITYVRTYTIYVHMFILYDSASTHVQNIYVRM